MSGWWRERLAAWRTLSTFSRLPRSDRAIAVYAEAAADWSHLGPLVCQLTGTLGRRVVYLTSDFGDPVLDAPPPGVMPFYVGMGYARTALFRAIECGALVLTMPDLESFFLKRSVAPVHYVYVFHSMTSTHANFRKGSYDNYDSILCAGPHHREEIRATERAYGLAEKRLVDCGYLRLDTILADATSRPQNASGDPARILIAPSYGPTAILEFCGAELVAVLLDAGLHVTVRPHPMTRTATPAVLDAVRDRYRTHERLVWEEDIGGTQSFHDSDIMISDWSGAALEYAFGRERPVLFIDVPRKLNNPDWERIGLPTIEDAIRDRIGAIVSPDRLDTAPDAIRGLLGRAEAMRGSLRAERGRWIYNVGHSAEVAADYIVALPEVEAFRQAEAS